MIPDRFQIIWKNIQGLQLISIWLEEQYTCTSISVFYEISWNTEIFFEIHVNMSFLFQKRIFICASADNLIKCLLKYQNKTNTRTLQKEPKKWNKFQWPTTIKPSILDYIDLHQNQFPM